MATSSKQRRQKSKPHQLVEYVAVYFLMRFLQLIPHKLGYFFSNVIGRLLYLVVPKRRELALDNLRHAFQGAKSDKEIQAIALQSCCSVVASMFEAAKFRSLLKEKNELQRISAEGTDQLFLRAKEIHKQSQGCIFVTPHLGNWEVFPYAAAAIGIPLVIVARSRRNRYLHDLLYNSPSESGQVIIPNINAMFLLQESLRQGKSVGMLADQSTRKGISVKYFGRNALTTPMPAILSILYNRPIVVVACFRKSTSFRFEGTLSEPIWPQPHESERVEVYRLTQEMNQVMESIVRRHPDQYLWFHNRWKGYRAKTEVAW